MKGSLLFSLLVCFAFVLSACASPQHSIDDDHEHQNPDEHHHEQEPGTTTLKVFNWEEYISPELLSEFEEKHGITIEYTEFEEQDIVASILQSNPSAHDVVFVSQDVGAGLFELGLLSTLDKSLLTNLGNIDEAYRDLPDDPNNDFSVPYTWGTTGIIYNTKFVSDPQKSWGALWNPAYTGNIGMLDSGDVTIGYTLISLGKSLNSRDGDDIALAKEKLLEQVDYDLHYGGAIELRDLLINEELWISPLYSGDAVTALERNENLSYFVPDEGSDLYIDVMVIPIAAKNKAAAHKFIDFMTSTDSQVRTVEYVYFPVPITQAVADEYLSPELLANTAVFPTEQEREKLQLWDYSSVSETSSVALNAAWSEVQRKYVQ